MCGWRWKATKMGIDDWIATLALEIESKKAADTIVSVWSRNLNAIPSIGRKLHLGDNLKVRGLAS